MLLSFAITLLLIAPAPVGETASAEGVAHESHQDQSQTTGEQTAEVETADSTQNNGFMAFAEPTSLNSDNLVISNANPTENGGWLELTNPTDTAISTKGLYLSVNAPCGWESCNVCTADSSCNWQMPAVIVRPNQTVRVRARGNNVCPVLKRMQTNFDLAFGQTVRLVDVNGNVLSEFGIVDSSAPHDFFATGDMNGASPVYYPEYGFVFWYTPFEDVTFIVPQNVVVIQVVCPETMTTAQRVYPGETMSVQAGYPVHIEFTVRMI